MERKIVLEVMESETGEEGKYEKGIEIETDLSS